MSEQHNPKKPTGILLCLFILLLSGPAYAVDDKVLHFGISSIVGYAAETALHKHFNSNSERVIYGTLLGSMPGLIKEIKDSGEQNNHFSGDDMAADIAGAFVGALLANQVNKRFMVNIQKEGDAYLVGFVYQ